MKGSEKIVKIHRNRNLGTLCVRLQTIRCFQGAFLNRVCVERAASPLAWQKMSWPGIIGQMQTLQHVKNLDVIITSEFSFH